MMLQIQARTLFASDAQVKTTTDVIRELRGLIASREKLWKALDRKRSMRPSERAMSKAAYGAQIDALQICIGVFTGMIKLTPETTKQEEHAS